MYDGGQGMISEEILNIDGEYITCTTKEVIIRDGISAGRINVSKTLIGKKMKLILVDLE